MLKHCNKMKAILMLVVNPSLDHNFIAKTDNYFAMFRKYNDVCFAICSLLFFFKIFCWFWRCETCCTHLQVCLLLFILPQRGPPRESSSHLFLNDAETDNPQPWSFIWLITTVFSRAIFCATILTPICVFETNDPNQIWFDISVF